MPNVDLSIKEWEKKEKLPDELYTYGKIKNVKIKTVRTIILVWTTDGIMKITFKNFRQYLKWF